MAFVLIAVAATIIAASFVMRPAPKPKPIPVRVKDKR